MRSIYRSKKHAATIQKLLVRDQKADGSAFPYIKNVQTFAALLGFANGRREPFERKDVEGIEWHTYDSDQQTHYIYLIALAETKDLNILRYDVEASAESGAPEDMVKIFEEYANGGFGILESWLAKLPADPYGAKAVIEGLRRAGYLTPFEEDISFEKISF